MSGNKPIILFDTNMLLLMADGIPVLEQIEEKTVTKPRYVVIRPVYNELLRIANKSNGIMRKKALFALQLVEQYFEILDFDQGVNESVDDVIIRFAMEHNAIVATNDRELRSRLRQHNIAEIYFREEARRIEIEGILSHY